MAGFYDVGKLVATLGLNTAPFMASAKNATDSMRKLNLAMMATGRAMTRFVTLPMAIAGGAAIGMQRDFEKSMTKIIGLVGVARGTVEEWSKAILEMAPELSRSPKELADAMYFITSAGIRGAEALDILEMSAKAAAAGLGETKVVADLVTSAINAYGQENLNAAQATDILVATVREGKAEADSLAGAMGKVLPIASAFGVAFDEVGAAFAAMTRTGTNADIAATQLKAILSQMASPSVQAAKAMAKAGTSAEKFRQIMDEDGLINALLHLRTAVNNNKAAFSEVFPNIRALMGVLDLLGENLDSNIDIFNKLKNATGSTDRAFEEYQKTTDYKLNKAITTLKVSFTELGQVMKSPVLDILEDVIDVVKRMSEWFKRLSESQQAAILKAGALIAVMGPVLLIFSRLSVIISASPWAALAVAIGVAATALSGFLRIRKNANSIMKDSVTQEQKLKRSVQEEQMEIANLFTSLRTAKKGTEEWDTARTTLNSKYGIYLDNLITEKTSIDEIYEAQKKVMSIMFNKSMAQHYADMAAKMAVKWSDAMQENLPTFMDLMFERRGVLEQRSYGNLGFSDFTSALRKAIEGDIAEMGGTLEAGFVNLSNRASHVYNTFVRAVTSSGDYDYEKFKKGYFAMAEAISAAGEEYKYLNFMAEEYRKQYEELTGMELFPKGEGGTGEDPAVKRTKETVNAMGAIPRLQDLIKDKEAEILGAREDEIPALNDQLMFLQWQLETLQKSSEVRGQLAQLDQDILDLNRQASIQSGEDLMNTLEQVRMKELEKRAILAQVGGLGEIEAKQLEIAEAEILRADASGILLEQYNEQLRVLKGQLQVMQNRGTEEMLQPTNDTYSAWKKYYDWKLQKAKEDVDNHAMTMQEYEALEVEWAEKSRKLRAESVGTWLSVTNEAIGAISTLIETQKQKELSAVGDNAKLREKIEREYYQKQKKWSIAQALINGALAITNLIANVPGSVINPATWVGIGIAAASTAAQVALISAQSFAQGGLVYGDTLAKVGDYPGAGSNPEVIAPLSDLKKLIEPKGAGMPKFIKLVAEGKDMVATIDMQRLLNNTY